MKGIILIRATPRLPKVKGNDPHSKVSVTTGSNKITAVIRKTHRHCCLSATRKAITPKPLSGKVTENAITLPQNAADGDTTTSHDQRSQASIKRLNARRTVWSSMSKSTNTQSGINQSQCQPKPPVRPLSSSTTVPISSTYKTAPKDATRGGVVAHMAPTNSPNHFLASLSVQDRDLLQRHLESL
jgi:hypothetical protein